MNGGENWLILHVVIHRMEEGSVGVTVLLERVGSEGDATLVSYKGSTRVLVKLNYDYTTRVHQRENLSVLLPMRYVSIRIV